MEEEKKKSNPTTQNTGRKSSSNNRRGNKPNGPLDKANKVVSGAGHVVKTIGGVVSVAKGIIDLVKLIKQHPEWYTHYETHNLIGLNLAAKQQRQYPSLKKMEMPSVACVEVQLTVPQGDEEGWRSGIRLLYQQLKTANSGKVNYTVKDLEKYVLNVRALHACAAHLCRSYRLSYTFRSTNARIPELMLNAAGLDAEDILSNAADLLMYTQRFVQQISVNFPLNIDLYARTHWLFGNIFADSNSQKPSFYIPSFSRRRQAANEGIGINYYTSNFSYNSQITWNKKTTWNYLPTSGSTLMTYQEYVSQLDKIKNDLIDDDTMGIIAGDIIKTFGDTAFIKIQVPEIDSSAEAVFDEYILNQFQNSTPIAAAVNIDDVDDISNGVTGPDQIDGFNYNETATSGSWIESTLVSALPKFDMTAAEVNETFNKVLINWSRDSISTGEIMSITRFVATGANITSVSTAADATLSIYGTEVITRISAYAVIKDGATIKKYQVPIAGRNRTTSDGSGTNYYGDHVLSLWACFDYAPRLQPLRGLAGTAGAVFAPEVLDWDVFSLVDKDWLSNYFSYGNQSLLYAGASQNQSNSRVYGRKTGKKYTNNKQASKTKKEDADVIREDKK